MIGAGSPKGDWAAFHAMRALRENAELTDRGRVMIARELVRSVRDHDALSDVNECIMTLREKANGLKRSKAYHEKTKGAV